MSSTDPRGLAGRWRVQRRLAERSHAEAGTFDGALVLQLRGDAMHWDEAGCLTWGGRRVEVSRSYVLRESAHGWWVHFADGRPFHPWTPGDVVEHLCGDDVYRGLVRLDGPDDWRVFWRVTGPAKDQRIVSRLSRC